MENETKEKNGGGKPYYPGIDIVKFFLAIFVVALHYPPLTTINIVADNWVRFALVRIAVPFYFITSGFFAFKNMNQKTYRFSDSIPYIKKLFRLYITWSILTFPVAIYTEVGNHPYLPIHLRI